MPFWNKVEKCVVCGRVIDESLKGQIDGKTIKCQFCGKPLCNNPICNINHPRQNCKGPH